MHQENRGCDHRGAIIASIADYTAVRSLVNDLIADAVGATVPTSIREKSRSSPSSRRSPMGVVA